jgi:hypothetical protein
LEGGLMPPSITLAAETISANISRDGEYIDGVSVKSLNVFPIVSISKKASPLSATVSVLCSVGVFERDHELFYVKEGVFLLVDGKKLKVLKYEL